MKTTMRRTLVSVILLLTMGFASTLRAQSSSPVQYFYDATGRLVKVVDQNGNIASYTYDALSNLLSITRSALPGSGGLAVLNFTPQQGPVGTTVTIQGQGFSTTPGANTVQFNGTLAAVSAATANSLTVTVPSGTTTGPISVTVGSSTASSSSNFTIVSPTLVSISVTPLSSIIPIGAPQQFAATGTYSDGSAQDVTALVTWSFSASGVASISNTAGTKGLALGVSPGYTVVQATSGSVVGTTGVTVKTLTSLTVSSSSYCVALGSNQPLTATGAFADGTNGNITQNVTWSSSNTAVATVSNAKGSQGIATAVSVGLTTITATIGGTTGSVTLGVTNLSQLAVWEQQDVGQVGVGGCGSYGSDVFTVEGLTPPSLACRPRLWNPSIWALRQNGEHGGIRVTPPNPIMTAIEQR